MLEEMRQQADWKKEARNAEEYDLQEHGELFGEIVDYRSDVATVHGSVDLLYFADAETGVIYSVMVAHTALKSGLQEQGAEVGQMVYVRSEGKVTSRSGAEYYDYTVVVRDKDGA